MHSAPPPPKTATQLLRGRATRPGQTDRTDEAPISAPTLAEVFADSPMDGAATGFVLARLRADQTGRKGAADKPILWVQDRVTRRDMGRPYLHGLAQAGHDRPILYACVGKAADLLWVLEQGVGCPGLGAVIGELWGDPPALDFTATKRLAMRAEAHGVPCWLIRRGGQANLSAARERWRVGSLQSLTHPDDSRAPGAPVWQADLFRARWRAPGQWVARPMQDGGLHLDHGMEQNAAPPEERTG
ncbi:ImuA family protein [Marivivens marinus]|uniref:ImuA family protein n=1 Tax=Marivivens marinus TaxID=3110173 RepID=UPI003B847A53